MVKLTALPIVLRSNYTHLLLIKERTQAGHKNQRVFSLRSVKLPDTLIEIKEKMLYMHTFFCMTRTESHPWSSTRGHAE